MLLHSCLQGNSIFPATVSQGLWRGCVHCDYPGCTCVTLDYSKLPGNSNIFLQLNFKTNDSSKNSRFSKRSHTGSRRLPYEVGAPPTINPGSATVPYYFDLEITLVVRSWYIVIGFDNAKPINFL